MLDTRSSPKGRSEEVEVKERKKNNNKQWSSRNLGGSTRGADKVIYVPQGSGICCAFWHERMCIPIITPWDWEREIE